MAERLGMDFAFPSQSLYIESLPQPAADEDAADQT